MTADIRVRLELASKADAQAGLIGHLTIRITGVELRRVHGEPHVVLPAELEQLVLNALGLGPGGAR